ncbi:MULTISPECIES: hypothetical protein [Flavobacteriaceae]|jgi:hypothetical protein|uniref:Uncharacterized protein n=1 Tax=Flagellimonas marina TaxID=1775168 RepID=A0ABV8PQF4_9FLAO
MASRSKNEQSINKGILTSHVFTENGTVFLRSSEDVDINEWSAINFHWMPILQLERELGS